MKEEMEKLLQRTFRAEVTGEEGPSPARGCPDEMQLAAFAEGVLAGKPRDLLEVHLAGCRLCRDQVAFLVQPAAQDDARVPRSLLASAQELVGKRPAAKLGWTWRLGTATAIAAMLLVVVLLHERTPGPLPPPAIPHQVPQMEPPAPPAALETSPPASSSKTVRSATPKTAALRVISPKEGASLSPQQMEFRWTDVPGRVFYEVQVTTQAGTPVWQERTEATRIRVPGESFAATGGKYFFWVRAHLPGGKTVVSDVVSFQAASR